MANPYIIPAVSPQQTFNSAAMQQQAQETAAALAALLMTEQSAVQPQQTSTNTLAKLLSEKKQANPQSNQQSNAQQPNAISQFYNDNIASYMPWNQVSPDSNTTPLQDLQNNISSINPYSNYNQTNGVMP